MGIKKNIHVRGSADLYQELWAPQSGSVGHSEILASENKNLGKKWISISLGPLRDSPGKLGGFQPYYICMKLRY